MILDLLDGQSEASWNEVTNSIDYNCENGHPVYDLSTLKDVINPSLNISASSFKIFDDSNVLITFHFNECISYFLSCLPSDKNIHQ
jgi:hypothetical protein